MSTNQITVARIFDPPNRAKLLICVCVNWIQIISHCCTYCSISQTYVIWPYVQKYVKCKHIHYWGGGGGGGGVGVMFNFFSLFFFFGFYIKMLSIMLGARCSSVVRTFAHGAMGHWIDPSCGEPTELFLVPACAP